MGKEIFALCVGSTLGALLRWGLGLKLNGFFPTLPPGTLAANLIAAYVVGLAVAFFAQSPAVSGEWRALIITGFCGGLSTFSTFSLEVASLIIEGRGLWAAGTALLHVGASVLMTFAGMGTYGMLR